MNISVVNAHLNHQGLKVENELFGGGGGGCERNISTREVTGQNITKTTQLFTEDVGIGTRAELEINQLIENVVDDFDK